MVKTLPASAGDERCGFVPWLGGSLEELMATHSSIFGKSNQGGYSPQGHTKSDMAEVT